MNMEDARKLTPGLYRITWHLPATAKHGIHQSLAAIGHLDCGLPWFAASDWVGLSKRDVITTEWMIVASVEPIAVASHDGRLTGIPLLPVFEPVSDAAANASTRTYWTRAGDPELVIDLRKIAVVRRVERYHSCLTAFTEAGLEIQIPDADVESFMTAWRACP